MDAFVIKTKKLYDDVAAASNPSCSLQKQNPRESLKERASGPAASLKRAHNALKRELISRYCDSTNRLKLLDIACGRGGDLQKWRDAGVSFAKGLDISLPSIDEARRRYAALPPSPAKFESYFEATQNLGVTTWVDADGPYERVTCMFALHYFFGTEAAAKTLLEFVAANLAPGGVFFGVVPDGRRINALLMEGISGATPKMTLTAHWYGPPAPFGSAYVCRIEDTVVTKGSLEFLVYKSVLAKVAAAAGLDLVEWDHPVADPVIETTSHPATACLATFAFRRPL